MKKSKYLLLIIILPFVVACSNTKEAVSSDKFVKTIEKLGYQAKEEENKPDYAENIYTVNNEISIYFFEGKRRYDVEGIYVDECKNLLESFTSEYKKKASGGKNWNKLVVEDKDTYSYIIWVDKTYIYGKAKLKDKETLNKIMNKLGY